METALLYLPTAGVYLGATAAMVCGVRLALASPLEDRRATWFGLVVGGFGWFGWIGFVLAHLLRSQMGWQLPDSQGAVVATGLALLLGWLAWLAERGIHGSKG